VNLRKDHYQKTHCLLAPRFEARHFTTCAPFTLVNAIQARAPGHALRWLLWVLLRNTSKAVADYGRACQNNPKHHSQHLINLSKPIVYTSFKALFVFGQEKLGACFHVKRAPAMKIQLSATDVLAPTTMKNAAKCDT
jgi:hypothetical protein